MVPQQSGVYVPRHLAYLTRPVMGASVGRGASVSMGYECWRPGETGLVSDHEGQMVQWTAEVAVWAARADIQLWPRLAG